MIFNLEDLAGAVRIRCELATGSPAELRSAWSLAGRLRQEVQLAHAAHAPEGPTCSCAEPDFILYEDHVGCGRCSLRVGHVSVLVGEEP